MAGFSGFGHLAHVEFFGPNLPIFRQLVGEIWVNLGRKTQHGLNAQIRRFFGTLTVQD